MHEHQRNANFQLHSFIKSISFNIKESYDHGIHRKKELRKKNL